MQHRILAMNRNSICMASNTENCELLYASGARTTRLIIPKFRKRKMYIHKQLIYKNIRTFIPIECGPMEKWKPNDKANQQKAGLVQCNFSYSYRSERIVKLFIKRWLSCNYLSSKAQLYYLQLDCGSRSGNILDR